MNELEKKIRKIGKDMVMCNKPCKGVTNCPSKGIPPRCLYFEANGKTEKKGVVVIGINPGNAKRDDYKTELKRECNESPSDYYCRTAELSIKGAYYDSIKRLLNELGLTANILWTELIKCEKEPSTKKIPLQTYRNCIELYLKKELKNVPCNWPIIAVGKETYAAVVFLFPDRKILGISHSTKSFGQFSRMFTGSGKFDEKKLKQSIKDRLGGFLSDNNVSCLEIIKRKNGNYFFK
jgi:hypothetical protein